MPPDEPPVTAQAIADAAVDASAGAPSVEEIDVLKRVVETLTDFLTSYSLQIVGALVVLVLGTIVARILSHILLRFLERRNFDVTLSRFIASCMRGSVVGFAFVVALGKFGITIAPILAALGALAFGASIAVQGPLSNFGSGLAIIFLRPFVVDDTVAVSGVEGVVVEVKLGYTVLCDEDGIEIIVPNKEVFGQVMHNSKGRRLVEGVIGISYGDAPREAISVIEKIIAADEGVLQDPPPLVGVGEFADSSVSIHYRYWVSTPSYFEVMYTVNLAVFDGLAEAGITIPFPQRDVHLIPQES